MTLGRTFKVALLSSLFIVELFSVFFYRDMDFIPRLITTVFSGLGIFYVINSLLKYFDLDPKKGPSESSAEKGNNSHV